VTHHRFKNLLEKKMAEKNSANGSKKKQRAQQRCLVKMTKGSSRGVEKNPEKNNATSPGSSRDSYFRTKLADITTTPGRGKRGRGGVRQSEWEGGLKCAVSKATGQRKPPASNMLSPGYWLISINTHDTTKEVGTCNSGHTVLTNPSGWIVVTGTPLLEKRGESETR